MRFCIPERILTPEQRDVLLSVAPVFYGDFIVDIQTLSRAQQQMSLTSFCDMLTRLFKNFLILPITFRTRFHDENVIGFTFLYSNMLLHKTDILFCNSLHSHIFARNCVFNNCTFTRCTGRFDNCKFNKCTISASTLKLTHKCALNECILNDVIIATNQTRDAITVNRCQMTAVSNCSTKPKLFSRLKSASSLSKDELSGCEQDFPAEQVQATWKSTR